MRTQPNTHIRLLTGLLAVLSITTVLSPAALADSLSESITLSPVSGHYSVNAGSSVQDAVTVLNDGQTAYDFVVYGSPYGVKDIQYSPDFTTQQQNADAYKWLQFPQARWHVDVRQTVKVPFTVSVPKDASPGGHYGAIFAEVQPAGGSANSSVLRKKRVGMILYVNVNGMSRVAGRTQSVTIDWLQHRSPLQANVTIGNSGNADFQAKQSLTVADVFGRTIYQNTQEATVLPDRPRSVPLEWSGAPWLGVYKVTVTSTVLDTTTKKWSYVLMAPVWFLVLVVFGCGAGVVYAIRGHKVRR